MQAAFENEVGRLMQDFNTPGLAVEMVADGQRFKAYTGRLAADRAHPVTEKARFGTVCMIKLLIAIKILQLAEQNDLGLDRPIAEYLPELAQGPGSKGRVLTARHLLSYTGGFRSFAADRLLPLAQESWENCVRLLNDTDQLFTPGTVFNDDHLSHIILGQLIERLTRRPFLQAVCDDVLQPLGIKASDRSQDCEFPEVYAARHAWNPQARQWEPEPDLYREPSPAFAAISHLSLTCGELLTLGQALLPGSTHFSPWILDRLFKPEVAVPRTFHPLRITRWHARGFGLGMAQFREGHTGFVSTGPGQTCGVFFDRQRKSLVALAMNSENVLEREALLNLLFARFAGDTSITPESKSLDIGWEELIAPFAMPEIGGVYVGFRPEPVEVFAHARGLVLRVNGQDQCQFEATAENRTVMRTRLAAAVGFFPDPVTKSPCLMMAMNAFKKLR